MDSSYFLQFFAFSGPGLFMCGLGAILAIVNMSKYPSAAICALGAFACWGLVPIVGQLVVYFLVTRQNDSGQSFESTQGVLFAIRGVSTLIDTVGYCLILIAVFGRRNNREASAL